MLGTVFEGARPLLYLVYARGLYLCLTIIVIVHLGLVWAWASDEVKEPKILVHKDLIGKSVLGGKTSGL